MIDPLPKVGEGDSGEGGHIEVDAGKTTDTATGGFIAVSTGYSSETSSGPYSLRTPNAGGTGVSGEIVLTTGTSSTVRTRTG